MKVLCSQVSKDGGSDERNRGKTLGWLTAANY